jgi:hypothetical protein
MTRVTFERPLGSSNSRAVNPSPLPGPYEADDSAERKNEFVERNTAEPARFRPTTSRERPAFARFDLRHQEIRALAVNLAWGDDLENTANRPITIRIAHFTLSRSKKVPEPIRVKEAIKTQVHLY